jgi:hypothetical protein
MQRKLGLLGVGLGLWLLMTQLWLAGADNMDPAEKICAQNLSQVVRAVLMYVQDYDERLRWLMNWIVPVVAGFGTSLRLYPLIGVM